MGLNSLGAAGEMHVAPNDDFAETDRLHPITSGSPPPWQPSVLMPAFSSALRRFVLEPTQASGSRTVAEESGAEKKREWLVELMHYTVSKKKVEIIRFVEQSDVSVSRIRKVLKMKVVPAIFHALNQ